MNTIAGRKNAAGLLRVVTDDVLQILLADEHRSHQRSEDDDPGTGGDPEDPPPGDLQVIEGLAAQRCRHTKAAVAARAINPKSGDESALPGTGARLIDSTRPATSTTEEDAAEVVDGFARLMTARAPAPTPSVEPRPRAEVIRKTDPHQNCPSSQPATSGPSEAMAPPSADHRAIDFVRPEPDHAVINASVVRVPSRQTAHDD